MRIKISLIIIFLFHLTFFGVSKTLGINEKENAPEILTGWELYEDSLRNEILRHKENKTLKESFLQEMYIRDIIKVSRDSLFAIIPFNVHSNDCGAPDCYTTEVSFCFKLTNPLTFPKIIRFYEYEYGCLEEWKELSGYFQLIEQTEKHIIYHSSEYKRTLVLFRSNKESGTFAFYFTDVDKNSINGKNVYTIRNEYDEEDPKSSYPFTSTILNIFEYERFLP